MSFQQKIEFRDTRNFSQTIAVATAFIRQNITILAKSLFTLAIPVTLFGLIGYSLCYLSAIGSIFGPDGVLSPETVANGDALENIQYIFYSYLFLPFMLVGYAAATATIYEYMRLYVQGSNTWEELSPQVVVKQVFKKIWFYIGTFLLLYVVLLLAIVPFFIAILLAFATAALSPILGVIFSMLLMCVFVYFIVASSFVLIIRVVEDLPFFSALSRSFELIKGHWWQTFGLLVISTMISYSITALPAMLSGGILGALAFFSVEKVTLIGTALQAVYGLIGIFANSVLLIVLAFQYFNLVEQKEAVGLRYRINDIGSELAIQ